MPNTREVACGSGKFHLKRSKCKDLGSQAETDLFFFFLRNPICLGQVHVTLDVATSHDPKNSIHDDVNQSLLISAGEVKYSSSLLPPQKKNRSMTRNQFFVGTNK